MDVDNPKYFDYFDEYGAVLQSRFRIPDLVKKVTVWRKNGMDDPEGVGSGCRNVIEKMLNALIANPSLTKSMTVEEKINYAKLHKKISDSFSKKFHEIRKIGNRSAHDSINFLNAEKSLILLDEILRKYIYESGIDGSILYSIAIIDDAVFTVLTNDEKTELTNKARTAAILSGDSAIEKEVKNSKEAAEQQDAQTLEVTEFMNSILDEIDAKKEKLGIGDKEKSEALEKLDGLFSPVVESKKTATIEVQRVVDKVGEILNEYDFIKKLLKGNSEATSAQLEVLAFPKTSNTTTKILQIAGGAGTGKTLCLLAKLIRDIEDDIAKNAQGSLFGNTYKKALFVCFNKQLAGYVKDLAKNYPKVSSRIEIVSFDQYINQLVRIAPSREFQHLAEFAGDVRYPERFGMFGLSYDKSFAKKAMQNISKLFPTLSGAYYLNYLESGNVAWVNDEIRWLESRYENVLDAASHYLSASRVGRGRVRRPDENVRKVILKIWENYRKLLDESNHYNIEQATKCLMKSELLPKYDVIAVDEVQDFTVSSIKLLLKFRKSDKSQVYISGDEGQKIYQRDFTWKELDSDVKGYTITLQKNMRNSSSIQAFANRLLGKKTAFEHARNGVSVAQASDDRIVQAVRKLQLLPNETTVVIGDDSWHEKISGAGIPIKNPKTVNQYGRSVDTKVGLITEPGIYIISEFSNKGLEFDNVIIANAGDTGKDIELEKMLRYVHFTRARKRLYVCYRGTPSELLRTYYSDFL